MSISAAAPSPSRSARVIRLRSSWRGWPAPSDFPNSAALAAVVRGLPGREACVLDAVPEVLGDWERGGGDGGECMGARVGAHGRLVPLRCEAPVVVQDVCERVSPTLAPAVALIHGTGDVIERDRVDRVEMVARGPLEVAGGERLPERATGEPVEPDRPALSRPGYARE